MNKRAPGSYQDPNTKIAYEGIVFLSVKGFGDNSKNIIIYQYNNNKEYQYNNNKEYQYNNNKEFFIKIHKIRNYTILLLHTALVKIGKLFLIKKQSCFIRKGGVYRGKTQQI